MEALQETADSPRHPRLPPAPPQPTAFVGRGRRYDRYLKLWDTETGQCISAVTNRVLPYCCQLHPDDPNTLLAGCSNKHIVQYDMRSCAHATAQLSAPRLRPPRGDTPLTARARGMPRTPASPPPLALVPIPTDVLNRLQLPLRAPPPV